MYYSRKQPDKAQDMNQTATAVSPDKKIMVDTAHLMARSTAANTQPSGLDTKPAPVCALTASCSGTCA
jgi:hypothetical protein